LAIFLLFISYLALAEVPLKGKWYRNDLFASATLIIENGTFHITALNTAHHGEIEGELVKIKDGIFYTIIEENYYDEKCLIVFEEKEDGINVIVFGEQIGAGATVYYDGLYEKTKLDHVEYQNKALDQIIGNKYDKSIIRRILNEDLDYFIECFERYNDYPNNDKYISYCISGFLPGAGISQNGIIIIKGRYIEILLLDSRNDPWIYQYYTDGPINNSIGKTLMDWMTEYGDYNIKKYFYKGK
jgi:hypothetical protein